jgi:predicted nucleic acid-binding protein
MGTIIILILSFSSLWIISGIIRYFRQEQLEQKRLREEWKERARLEQKQWEIEYEEKYGEIERLIIEHVKQLPDETMMERLLRLSGREETYDEEWDRLYKDKLNGCGLKKGQIPILYEGKKGFIYVD